MRVITGARSMRRLAQAWRRQGRRIGFVPTMGALHEGHASLLRRARAENDRVIMSLFVNPTQFGPVEDLRRYPRTPAADLRLARRCGVDVIFAPAVRTIYPQGASTRVAVHGLSEPLEGRARPGHFSGVATVVTILFNLVTPEAAYFGQKDAQQVLVVRRLVRDLHLPVRIVVCPTVRAVDGLALSSRNAYLTPRQRRQARGLFRALQRGRAAMMSGVHNASAVQRVMRRALAAVPGGRIDYADVVEAETLTPLRRLVGRRRVLLALAVQIGRARLIDNLVVRCPVRARAAVRRRHAT